MRLLLADAPIDLVGLEAFPGAPDPEETGATFLENARIKAMEAQGLKWEATRQLAKTGAISWFLFGKLLGQKQISKIWLKLFDKTVWLWKLLEWLMPWNGLTVVVVAKKP